MSIRQYHVKVNPYCIYIGIYIVQYIHTYIHGAVGVRVLHHGFLLYCGYMTYYIH